MVIDPQTFPAGQSSNHVEGVSKSSLLLQGTRHPDWRVPDLFGDPGIPAVSLSSLAFVLP